MTKNAIVAGSLGAIAKTEGLSVAEVFLGAEIVVLLDWSGSMETSDAGSNKTRKQVAKEHLIRLQKDHPGKVGLVCFADYPLFCVGGLPTNCGGGTALEDALKYVKCVDDTDTKIVVVSDGLPNSPDRTLEIARTFKTKIDVIFVGPESDTEGGRAFLQKLANATSGQFFQADSPGLLAPSVETLMLAG